MTKQPLVSIIVPIYKVEKYLRTCLETLVEQTYSNIEILLIDDGSPDNCGAICDEFANKDTRIQVFHQQNQGVSVARNMGLEHSSGDWVSFIDPDDYLEKDFIEYLVHIKNETNADISYCGFTYYDEEGHALSEGKNRKPQPIRTFTSEEALIGLFRKKNEFANYIWNGLFRKSITTMFIPGKRTGQDQDFTIQCLLNAKLIARGYESKYNHILRFTGARSVNLRERMTYGFATLENIKRMLEESSAPQSVFSAFDENCMRLYFTYMDKYFEFENRDKSIFNELRSGIKAYTKKAIDGWKGAVASLFLGMAGQWAYRLVFYFVRKKDNGKTRLQYKKRK